jgi:Fe-S cluster assembly protein SufD
MVTSKPVISFFISTPNLFFKQQQFLKKKTFFSNIGFRNRKYEIHCKNSMEEKNYQKGWLESILSARNPPDTKYLEKWKKVGVNLIKAQPFPSRKDESWKLTSLDKIFEMRFSKEEQKLDSEIIKKSLEDYSGPKVVFVNGTYCEKLSDISSLNKNVFIGELEKYENEETKNVLEFLTKGESGINGGFFATLNIACLSNIYIVSIPPNLILETPINIIHIGSNGTQASSFNHRLIIISGQKSKSKIVEHHIGLGNSVYFDNTAVSVLTKEESVLDFFLINESSKRSTFINSIHADLKEGSRLNFSTISFGGLFTRVNLGIDINGTNCQCNVKGASIATDKQVSDFHSRISHNLPSSKSSQLQKILLTDKAHGVFAGKIQVQHGAGDTNSDQLCKTLLLSSSSRIDALPILEINNENVKCTHGSTVSDLDESQMFYLQSRGIPRNEAKKLLTVGFVNEMIQDYPGKIKSKIIKQLSFLI